MQKVNTHSLSRPLNIVFLLFLATCFLDRVIQEGMFFDGVTYAAISRNLAEGKGDFWNVYYRGDWRFSEHPPLMFGMEALFFKLFGDHYLTEKLFSTVIWLVSVVSLKWLWNNISKDYSHQLSYGLPILLWGIIPTVLWSYPNNMLDCVMGMFNMWAVLFIIRGLQSPQKQLLYLSLGVVFIFAATLTKGPVGMFPLAVPVIYWLIYRRVSISKAVSQTVLLTAIVAVIYAILYTYPPARACLNGYLDEQLFKALAGKREVVESPLGRFQLITMLGLHLSPAIGLALFIFVLGNLLRRRPVFATHHRQQVLFYLLIALSASLPIMLSMKQRSFYLMPALPFYSITLALLVHPWYHSLVNSIRFGININRIISVVLIAAGVGCGYYISTKIGQVGRDEDLIADLKTMQQILPEGEKVGICIGMNSDFGFLAYIQRYHKMEVDLAYHRPQYVLLDPTQCSGDLSPCLTMSLGYVEIPAGFRKYRLFKRDKPYSPPSVLPGS